MIIEGKATHDCAPTLTSPQVIEFCRTGFLRFDAVVPQDVNRRTCERMDELVASNARGHANYLFAEPWFVDGVLLNPAVAGAVRSLLGPEFGLPTLLSSHRAEEAGPAQAWVRALARPAPLARAPRSLTRVAGAQHHDGDSQFGPAIEYLQVFYYPQTVTAEMGPTEVLPSSHFLPHYASPSGMSLADEGGWSEEAELTTAPAGSIFITIYSILHRRAASTHMPYTRNLRAHP